MMPANSSVSIHLDEFHFTIYASELGFYVLFRLAQVTPDDNFRPSAHILIRHLDDIFLETQLIIVIIISRIC
uniref:Uncharacterized protein n=1 Tax=Candidatus Kentrum sp. TUN TaxID=2126343 RepID=A0A450ZCA0_9GAMM|nr:MAG: hypothetical protein BECKTUN1418E_GA0071001_100219 [Candidatus Kentron sp. TUN]VFK51431.1 MAG: hypothetical protein BECKTUN1418F_GA0071002_100218 [Candidatus Kentron sp. TUN]VFK64463.1 MAG: hypothetical protein BECKTUN1418D_GA0071000_12651 [Candidatus Kentron sp. TUN]